MGFKDSVQQKYAETFYEKNKDRLAQVQGKILQEKVERKKTFFFFHKLIATILVKPVGSRNIVKCVYEKKRFFKPVTFITVQQGHSVIIQGLKGKKNKKGKPTKGNTETISIMNIRNLTNKQDLVPMEQEPKVQKVRDKRFK